ncbi:MAG: hypothetical protein MUE40_13685 [Anaerolineae bacterium]|nr:hypothetical protein [Anaerolineae bacterium]
MPALIPPPPKTPRPEDDRMNQIIQARLKSTYGGTASKLKYNTGLKGRHRLTRNTKALPGWRDLDGRYKGLFLGLAAGILLGIPAYLLLSRAAFVVAMGTGGALLAALTLLLLVIVLAGVGFILGRVTE